MKKTLLLFLLVAGLSVSFTAHAETATFYYNSYSNSIYWSDPDPGYEPSKITDGDEDTFGDTYTNALTQLLDGNTCSGTNLGTITKVEIRPKLYTNYGGITFVPVFSGTTEGDSYNFPDDNVNTPTYKTSIDITNDTQAPSTWSWSDVQNLDLNLIPYDIPTGDYVGASHIQIVVTYGEEEPPAPEPPVYDHLAFYTVASTTASSTEIYFADFFLDIFNYLAQLFLILFGVIILLLVLFITLKVWE